MLDLLGHAGGGVGGNPILTPWEIHPMLIHFPIAFLLGGVLLSAYASFRGRLHLQRFAAYLFAAGAGLGWVTAAAGLLAFFTVPDTHTEISHQLMYWHLGFMAASLLMFTAVAWILGRNQDTLPRAGTHILMWLATAIFVVGAAFGGWIVYHGGTGIEADLLKPGLHEGHHPGHEQQPGKYPGGMHPEPSHESH